MQRLLILGSGGRLGAALRRAYAHDFHVTGLNRDEVDLSDLSAIEKRLGQVRFDWLINCAALTNVDYCEEHRAEAMRVNAEAPALIAQLCHSRNSRLIHISTDYVFDGQGNTPYEETDAARPLSVYGESKRAGEELVLGADERHLVVRVSWVFGPDRPSFIDYILQTARRSDDVAAVADKFSTPTYTLDLAFWLRTILLDASLPGGLLHLANGGACSWLEYAQHALDCCHRIALPVKARQVRPLRLSEMKNFIAQRPPYTVLATSRFQARTGVQPRDWRAAVADYIASQLPKYET